MPMLHVLVRMSFSKAVVTDMHEDMWLCTIICTWQEWVLQQLTMWQLMWIIMCKYSTIPTCTCVAFSRWNSQILMCVCMCTWRKQMIGSDICGCVCRCYIYWMIWALCDYVSSFIASTMCAQCIRNAVYGCASTWISRHIYIHHIIDREYLSSWAVMS